MLDFNKIKTYPINERKSKVSIKDFYNLEDEVKYIYNQQLDILAERIIDTYKKDKQFILMMGAHVIKRGLSLYIIDLMEKGIIKHVALNGAGSIHDFEIALIGKTSEYVDETIKNGSFGMVEETGKLMNETLKKTKSGYGKAIGKKIKEFSYKEYSILYTGFKLDIPVTVHVAIGNDIIHQHPSCDGAAIGRTSYKDFKLFCDSVSKLEEGVLTNFGSAVILPEVFLKALSISRNLGYKLENITAANLDKIDHYRPKENIVKRPTNNSAWKGLNIIARHEVTIPNLYRRITENI